MRRLFSIIALSLLFFTVQSQNLSLDSFVSLKPHPRLILQEGDVAALLKAVETSPQMGRLDDYIISQAEQMLEQPVSVYKKQGKRLLSVSRAVLERVLFCSYAYLTTKDVNFAARAEREMVAAAEFENWNPSHFLDVTEMTTALALGYDWL